MNKLNIYYVGKRDLINFNYSTVDIQYSTLEECYKVLKDSSILSIDIETTRKFNKYGKIEGLDPYTSKIVMLQIGTKDIQFVIDTRYFNVKDILSKFKDKTFVGHNLKFEYKHIFHNYGVKLYNLYDTFIAEKILYNGLNLSNSLENLNKRYLDIEVDKSTRLEFLDIKDRPFTLKQIVYGAEDILYPLLIRDRQLTQAKRRGVAMCIDLEFLFIPVVAEMEYNGSNLDREKWTKIYEDNLKKYLDLKNKLNSYIIKNFSNTDFIERQLDLFNEDLKCSISWSSPIQVANFFKYLDICPKVDGKYTVNASVLKSFKIKHLDRIDDDYLWLIDTYLTMKETEKLTTTYGEDFFKYLNPISNKLHSNFNQIVNTGRLSSSKPNLQNIPSDESYRECFIASEGCKLITADYSGQETVVLANDSKDKNMLSFYKSGENDMHSYNAKMIFKGELKDLSLSEIKNKHPDLREKAKPVSFAIPYGGNGATIAENAGISLEEGDYIYNEYFNAFPGLKSYFKVCRNEALSQNYILIDNISGRKYFFSGNWRKDFKLKGKYERAAVNYKIQGTSGSITKLALINVFKYIRDNNLEDELKIILTVHDEIVLESKRNHSKHAKALEDAMLKGSLPWCKIVPLTAEAVIDDYWHQ